MADTFNGRPVKLGKRRPARHLLVTGAAGFIGFHICSRLLARGDTVLGLDNLNTYYDLGLKESRLALLCEKPGFTFVRTDLAEPGAFAALLAAEAPDAVIHMAAQAGVRYSLDHPDVFIQSNVAGFLNVLEACRAHPVRHLIYASSSSVYGANTSAPFSEHHAADHPVSLYAATKRANELMAHSYAHLFGIPATGLRFFTVYGPWGRPDMAYFSFTRAIAEGRPIDLYNEGRMERDFTYIDDVTKAVVALVDRPPAPDPDFDPARPDPATAAAPHRVYNIGNHTPVPLTRFVAVIETALGRKAEIRLRPMQPGDVVRTFADVSDLAAAVGFTPKTSIEDGIERFVAWYQDYYGILPAGDRRKKAKSRAGHAG